MGKIKNKKGITLIALVITIIVLLILAGVSLSLIAGGDGILGRAESAVDANKVATAKEEAELLIAEKKTEWYEKKYVNEESVGTFKDYLKTELGSGEMTSSGNKVTVDTSGNIVIKDESGNIISTGTLDDNGKLTWADTTIGGTTPTTPTTQKYTVTYNANGGKNAPSSQTDESGKTIAISSNKPTKREYNFVGWSSNSSATSAEYNSGDNITLSQNLELYAVWNEQTQAEKSTKPEEHTPTGFSYKEGTVDTGYVISDGTNEFVWIPVANDEAYAKKLGTNNYMVKSGSSGYDHATDLGNDVTKAVQGDALGVDNILGTSVNSTLDANQPEYAVVKKAGGFWVGRYEAGVENETHSDIAGYTGYTNDSTSASALNTYWESKKTSIKVAQNMEPVRNITQSGSLAIANTWKSGSADTTKDTVAFQSGLITGSRMGCNV